jgi:AraC-like DNA-binding protein
MADYTEQGWLYISLEQLVNICAFIYMIYWIWDIKDLYDLVDNTYSNSIHLSDLLSGDSEESAKPDFIESARQHSATPPSIVQTTAVEEVVINSEELPVENAENKAYLTSQQCEDLSKQLLTVFEAEQLYLNANLTLLDIAKRFKLRTYELSWLLNQYMKVSFTDFVNKYRVEYAKELLMRNMHKTYNIEGIGKLSGFSTKSTFFRVFKQSTGFSPLQYADQKSVKQST